jgi:hypothetical protein
MPTVKGKKFDYTPEGKAEAAAYAQEHGAPFQMKAKAWNNSPMQKNWGDQLAINKKLDKDSGTGKTGQPGPIQKKTGVTSKLDKSNMEGGLTGKVGLGELDGPLRKNWTNTKPKGMTGSNKWSDPSNVAKRAKLGSDVQSFFKGLKGSAKDIKYKLSGESGKKRMTEGGYTPYKDRKAAVKAKTHTKKYSGALGATKGAGEKFKVKPTKKDEDKGNGGFKATTFGGNPGDPYTYRTTKGGGYEFSKDKKTWTTASKKSGISAIDKIFKKYVKKK